VAGRRPRHCALRPRRAHRLLSLPQGITTLTGYKDMGELVASLAPPRWVQRGRARAIGAHAAARPLPTPPSLPLPRSRVLMLVQAGAPVDATIDALKSHLSPGDIVIDGGNEWYENTERRAAALAPTGIKYIGMGVSGGEEGARNGPSMMPGGDKSAFDAIEPIIKKIAAQVDDGPCTMYVGPGGAGNFVKMVHNGIEYGDMQVGGKGGEERRRGGIMARVRGVRSLLSRLFRPLHFPSPPH